MQRNDPTADSSSPLESEEKYRLLVEALPLGVGIVQDGRIVFANQAAEDMFAVEETPEQYLGRAVIDSIAPEERERVAELMRRRSETGADAPLRYTTVMLRNNGQSFPVEVFARAMLFNGRPAAQVVLHDLSESIQAERSLWGSEERYRRLVEMLPEGVSVSDLDGNVVWMNAVAARMHGLEDPALALAQEPNAYDFIVPEQREVARQAGKRLLQTNLPVWGKVTSLRRDGSTFPAEVTAVLLRDADGQPQGFLGITRDTTEQVRQEAERLAFETQLHQTQKLESLGVMAGGIAHDFNNLLMGVLGNASLARAELSPESPVHDKLAQIEIAAQRAAELTRQLLTYSGKTPFEARAVALPALVQEMAELLRTVISRRIAVEYRFARELPPVRGDPTQLRQVVMNLMTNAAEAIGTADGLIDLSIEVADLPEGWSAATAIGFNPPPGPCAVLAVRDSGSGMENEVQRRIFEPFFSTKFTGRGLGLAVVSGIVRRHGGGIRLESTPGQGTRFSIALPLATPADTGTQPGSQTAETIAAGAALTVLVVDDEPSVRQVTAAMLVSLGHRAEVAQNGREALRRVEQGGLSVVLLDLTMPGMDGRETLLAMRAADASLPVILMSGYSELEAAERIGSRELAGFLQKPFRPQSLAEVLARVQTSR